AATCSGSAKREMRGKLILCSLLKRYFRNVKCSENGAYLWYPVFWCPRRPLLFRVLVQSSIVAGWSARIGLFLGLGDHDVGLFQQRLFDRVRVLGHDRHHVLHRLCHNGGQLAHHLFTGRQGIKRHEIVDVTLGEVLLICRNHGLHHFIPRHMVEHLVHSSVHL